MTPHFSVLLLAVIAGYAAGDDICIENATPTQKFNLQLYQTFSADIEIVSQERQNVQYVKMYYSHYGKMIRMAITDNQINSDYYFYFKDDQILSYDYTQGRGSCKVSKLSTSLDNFLVGGIKPGSSSPATPMPLAAVHFMGNSGFGTNQINQKKLTKQEKIRGKLADVYQSCQKWTTKDGKNNIVLNVKHYFAAKDWAFPGNKDVSTLLAIKMEGTGKVMGQEDTYINHVYSYFNFRKGIDNLKLMETPDGIVCPGRKLDIQFPKLPTFIRFTSEVIDYVNGKYFINDEIYDYDRKLAIFRQPVKPSSKKDMTRLVTLLDFNSGMMYKKDQKMQICKKTAINSTKAVLPVYIMQGNEGKIFTPKQFFRADADNFAWLGPKTIRGMQADAWVAHTNDISVFPNAVVQWYFAPKVSSSNDANPSYVKNQWRMPIKFSLWPDAIKDLAVTTNIFHVDYSPVRPDFLDLSGCFINTQHFQLILKGSTKDMLYTDLEALKYNVYTQIEKVASVQHVQINKMKFYYLQNKDVVLAFVIGSDSDSDLAAVTKRVVSGVKNGQIKIKTYDPATKKFSKALPVDRVVTQGMFDENAFTDTATIDGHSFNAPKKDSGGYSSGSMAGLGIAMVLVGLVGGAGAGYAHTKFA